MVVKSFAKINLSIDVGPSGEDGYHKVDMIMQQLSFHDDVTVEYTPSDAGRASGRGAASDCSGSFDIEVSTNRYYLPVDGRNLAYRAAELMAEVASGKIPDAVPEGDFDRGDQEKSGEQYLTDRRIAPGKIRIDIKKRIPVAAGLAGGSGNAAAVIHALNVIWDLGLSLRMLMDLGAVLGSDVPFCVMGQARSNRELPEYIREDALASSCARATGRGTRLIPVTPLKSWIVIAKPRLSVSTRAVYSGIDSCEITERPDNDRLVKRMAEKAAPGRRIRCRGEDPDSAPGSEAGRLSVRPDAELMEDFINVLEKYTLKKYSAVSGLKKKMTECGARFALMSGSGPTIFGIFGSMSEAGEACEKIRKSGTEAYWTKTTI